MAPSRGTKAGKRPFLPKVHLAKPFPERRQNSGYPQVVGKAEFPSQMCFPRIQPKLGESCPLTAGTLEREQGRESLECSWHNPSTDQRTPEGSMSLTPFIQQPQTHWDEFPHPSLAGGITFPQIQPVCESLKLDPAKIGKSEQVLPAESANLSAG